jgi:hypothetical protein
VYEAGEQLGSILQQLGKQCLQGKMAHLRAQCIASQPWENSASKVSWRSALHRFMLGPSLYCKRGPR